MKFTSMLDYPEDFKVGDIIEVEGDRHYYGRVLAIDEIGVQINLDIDPGEEVTVYRYPSLVNPEDSLKLHNYFVAEQDRLEALADLPEFTEVFGENITELDSVFRVSTDLNDVIVEDVLGDNKISVSYGESYETYITEIPETVFVRADELVWINRNEVP